MKASDATTAASAETVAHYNRWGAGLLLLLILRLFPWASADLWYDEILTLRLFVWAKTGISGIFRDYAIANNHFLNSAITWLWLHLSGADHSEFTLRLPAILTAAATIAVILWLWRSILGDRIALTTALLVTLSPVYGPFAVQLRGYSLAMFLSALAVSAAWARCRHPAAVNGLILFGASLLLPLTMPSAAMASGALIMTLFLLPLSPSGLRSRLRRIAPVVTGSLAGLVYYLTLWPQFQAARLTSGGWESAAAVGLHLLLAFSLHLGILLTGFFTLRSVRRGPNVPAIQFGFLLALSCVMAALSVLLLPSPTGRSPFPRVFIVLLLPLTFAAAMLFRCSPAAHWPMKALLAGAALPAVLITLGCELFTARRLEQSGPPPQNLLMQYYRGQTGISAMAFRIAGMREMGELPAALRMTVSAYDYPAVEYYWQLAGNPPLIPGSNSPAVIPDNLPCPAPAHNYPLLLFFRTEDEARRASGGATLKLLAQFGHHRLYSAVCP